MHRLCGSTTGEGDQWLSDGEYKRHLVLGELQQDADGHWQIPVVELSYAPTGLAWKYYHVVLDRRERGWTVDGETRHRVVE